MATRFEYFTTPRDDWQAAAGGLYLVQSFTPQVSHIITSVKLNLFIIGSPGIITVGIYDTDHGFPTTLLCSGTYDANTLSTSTTGTMTEITLGAGTVLAANHEYAIQLSQTQDNPNLCFWTQVDSGGYTRGSFMYYSDQWYQVPGPSRNFEEWGNPISNEVSITVQSSVGGTVTCGPSLDQPPGTYYQAIGTSFVVSAQPSSNYQFTRWSDGSTENPHTFIVSGPITISPIFTLNSTGSKFKIVGFFDGGPDINNPTFWNSHTFNEIDVSKLTHLIVLGFNLTSPIDPTIIGYNYATDHLPEIINACHSVGCKVLIDISDTNQSFNPSVFGSLLVNYRTGLVNSCVNVVNTYGADGIYIDWEPKVAATANEVAAMDLFLQELYSQFSPFGRVIGITDGMVGSWGTQFSASSCQYLDFIDFESYYFRLWNSSGYEINYLNNMISRGYDKTKFLLDIWTWVIDGVGNPIGTYADLMTTYPTLPPDTERINAASLPSSFHNGANWPTSDGLLLIQNIVQTQAMSNYVVQNGLGGMYIFEVNGDILPTTDGSLLKAIADILQEEPPPPPPDKASVNIISVPKGALVKINGVDSGVTDEALDLDPGTYTVRVEYTGYVPQEKSVTLVEGSNPDVTFTLVKVPGATSDTMPWLIVGGVASAALLLFLIVSDR